MVANKNSATSVLNYLRARRLGLLGVLLVLVVLAGLITLLAFAVVRSMPQRNVVMALYPEGSLNAELVKRYRDVLARQGIDLKLEPSAGAVESLARLRDPKSRTSIALVPGGLTTAQESPQLVSLGTLFYQPLWIFSRGRPLQRRGQLRGLHVSIGPEGSSSRALALKLLGPAGIIDQKSATLLPLTPSESVQKLVRGEIDVAVFLEGWQSPAVQQLLKTKGVNLESIPRADAFVALYPYLNKLVLPAGVVDMAKPLPPTDVLLIAPKSSLVVRGDLNAAIQYLLLQAAVEIHSAPGMFHTASRFPVPESVDLPLSPHAIEFYKTGPPFLQRHLPFWLAVLLEQPLVWIIPLVVILFPLFRVAPAVYDWVEKSRVYRLYSELKRLEDEMALAAPGRTQYFIEQLDQLGDRATRLSVPAAFKPLLYGLRLHIDMVRQEAKKSIPP